MFRINIEKENLPYKFELNIKSVLYDFILSYNQKHDFFVVTLIKDEVIIVESEKIILNQPLFSTTSERPQATMGIYGINKDVKELTYENLNFQTAFVWVEDA